MRVSSKNSVQGRKVLEISKSIEAKQRNNNHTKSDDPQIPQPDLRFASGNSEANSRNKTKPKKRGQSPNKNTHRIDLPWTQWHIHCITIKNMQNELWITAVQADMKTIVGVNPSMSQTVHESRATKKSLSESSQISSSWAFMDIIVILLTVSRDHEAMML